MAISLIHQRTNLTMLFTYTLKSSADKLIFNSTARLYTNLYAYAYLDSEDTQPEKRITLIVAIAILHCCAFLFPISLKLHKKAATNNTPERYRSKVLIVICVLNADSISGVMNIYIPP